MGVPVYPPFTQLDSELDSEILFMPLSPQPSIHQKSLLFIPKISGRRILPTP
jgi:hypothetical protein